MSYHATLNERLDRIEATIKGIKARLVRYIAEETGQTEAQVLAGLAADREKRRIASLR